MPGQFYLTGKMIPTNTGHSFRVFVLDCNGKKIFIGYVSKKAVSALLQKQIFEADICAFSQGAAQEPLNFNMVTP